MLIDSINTIDFCRKMVGISMEIKFNQKVVETLKI